MSKRLHFIYKKFILLAVLKKKEKEFNSLFKELLINLNLMTKIFME